MTESMPDEGRLDPHADCYISVRALRADTGEPAEATVSPAGPALICDEYWTGPAPWWKRALYRLARKGWR